MYVYSSGRGGKYPIQPRGLATDKSCRANIIIFTANGNN